MGSIKKSLRVVDAFNKMVKVGDPVRYWPGLLEGSGKLGTLRAAAFLSYSDTPVAFVKETPGYIRVSHLAPVPE